ncbi:MAG: phosphotransferase [Pseudomonadota bacterium]
MSSRLTLSEALARLPGRVDLASVTAIGCTSTDDVYRLSLNGNDVVLRIADRGVDWQAALAIQRHAADRGIAPAVLLAAPDAGIAVTAYAPGRSLQRADMADPATQQAVGHLLRVLHSGQSVGHTLDLVAAIRRYVSRCPASVRQTAKRVANDIAKRLSAARPVQLVPCHNDPVADNFLAAGSLTLIDWEYAADNDPRFDLAVVSAHHDLDASGRLRLLSAYAPDDVERLSHELENWEAIYRGIHLLWASACSSNDLTNYCEVL